VVAARAVFPDVDGDALLHARSVVDARGLDAAVLGHAGDGNYHVAFPMDRLNPEEMRVAEEIVARALARENLHRRARCRNRQNPPPGA
jgi:FAD/FMN-containing dehydrogenase